MSRLILVAFLSLFSTCVLTQVKEMLHVKSFYYDVDNFSLTSESMGVLKEFVYEIKTKPIEIIEIVGYVEKNGSPVYNQIRSKKRMNSIKGSIDSAIVIHQYKPTNLDYPPSFLYSYTDGFNWRRVDIKYRYKDPIILLPSKDTENEDPFNTKVISPELMSTENSKILTNTIQIETELIEDKFISNESETNIISTYDTVHYKQVAKIYETKQQQEKTLIEKDKMNRINELDSISKKEITKKNDTLSNSKNELSIDKIDLKINKEIIENPLDNTEKISIEGKTQDQLDRIVIKEKSSNTNKQGLKNHPDLGMRLSKIRIQDLDKSIILLNMNLEFVGDEPIITASSLLEMDDLLNFLLKNNSVDAFIRGHVCCGDEMPLSKKRAKHVYNELIRRGVQEDRLRYQGFSNTLLMVSPELTESDRSKNRRVDIIFSKNNTRSNDPIIKREEVENSTIEDTVIEKIDENQMIQFEMDEDGNTEFNTSGKSQNQIDNLIVREKSSNKNPAKCKFIEMDKKLSNINVENLKNSVALVIMGAQFEGIDPIINQSSIKEMDDLFNFLNQNKQIHAFIRGHVCCGDDMKLSRKRAKYVYSELIKKGIDANRLRFQGFSNSLLLVSPEKTDADRAKNRRVDVIFSVKPIQTDK